MQNISPAWLYPIILVAGALQAWGPPMNHTLRVSLENPWLASLVSFLPIVALLACLIMCLPHPLPSERGLAEMPWWAPLGGLVGAFAVVADILMSLLIDRFGMFGMQVHEFSAGRIAGAALMVAGLPVKCGSGLLERRDDVFGRPPGCA